MRKAIYFDITSKCNLRCKHCYNAEKYFTEDKKDLTFEQIKEILIKLRRDGFNYIHLLGGEPLMYKQIVDVVMVCKKLDFQVSINTNATLLSESMIEKLIDLEVDQIGCSLDGYNSETNDRIRGRGTFEKIIENIRNLCIRKKRTQVQVVYTLTNDNYKNIELLPDLLEYLNIDVIDISLLFNAGNATQSWENIRISDVDLFQAIEKFVSLSVKRKYFIQIDNRPIFAYYLNLKYNMPITTNIDFTKCTACKIAYIFRQMVKCILVIILFHQMQKKYLIKMVYEFKN